MNPDDVMMAIAVDPYGQAFQSAWGSVYTGTTGAVSNTSYQNTTIQGKMLTVSHEFDDFAMSTMTDEDIKSSLTAMLVREMSKSNMVEFTRQSDPLTFKITVRARAFVVPDDKVRLLRKNGVQ